MKYLVLVFSFFSLCAFSQTEDAALWTGIGIKANLSKKLSLKYETQARFFKNISTLQNYYNELSVDYGVAKGLDLGVTYRYARKNSGFYYRGENRIAADASYRIKFSDLGLRIKARARYQFSFDRLSVINNVIYPDFNNTFRFKLDARYNNDNFKRIIPYVGCEVFKAIHPVSNQPGLDAYRLFGGVNFDLPARHELGLKYIYELEFRSTEQLSHIYVIQYNYQLPNKWFKKKKKKD